MFKVIHLEPLQFDKDFQEWILLLLSLTDASLKHIRMECLQEVLSRRYYVTRNYHNYVSYDFHTGFSRSVYRILYLVYALCTFLSLKIVEQTKTRIKGLPVKHFCSVYASDPSWGREVHMPNFTLK